MESRRGIGRFRDALLAWMFKLIVGCIATLSMTVDMFVQVVDKGQHNCSVGFLFLGMRGNWRHLDAERLTSERSSSAVGTLDHVNHENLEASR